MNKIKFNCPSCNAKLKVPQKLAGVAGPCPKCAATIVAPLHSQEAPVSGGNGSGRNGSGHSSGNGSEFGAKQVPIPTGLAAAGPLPVSPINSLLSQPAMAGGISPQVGFPKPLEQVSETAAIALAKSPGGFGAPPTSIPEVNQPVNVPPPTVSAPPSTYRAPAPPVAPPPVSGLGLEAGLPTATGVSPAPMQEVAPPSSFGEFGGAQSVVAEQIAMPQTVAPAAAQAPQVDMPQADISQVDLPQAQPPAFQSPVQAAGDVPHPIQEAPSPVPQSVYPQESIPAAVSAEASTHVPEQEGSFAHSHEVLSLPPMENPAMPANYGPQSGNGSGAVDGQGYGAIPQTEPILVKKRKEPETYTEEVAEVDESFPRLDVSLGAAAGDPTLSSDAPGVAQVGGPMHVQLPGVGEDHSQSDLSLGFERAPYRPPQPAPLTPPEDLQQSLDPRDETVEFLHGGLSPVAGETPALEDTGYPGNGNYQGGEADYASDSVEPAPGAESFLRPDDPIENPVGEPGDVPIQPDPVSAPEEYQMLDFGAIDPSLAQPELAPTGDNTLHLDESVNQYPGSGEGSVAAFLNQGVDSGEQSAQVQIPSEPEKTKEEILDELLGAAPEASPKKKGLSKASVFMLSILGAVAVCAAIGAYYAFEQLGGFSLSGENVHGDQGMKNLENKKKYGAYEDTMSVQTDTEGRKVSPIKPIEPAGDAVPDKINLDSLQEAVREAATSEELGETVAGLTNVDPGEAINNASDEADRIRAAFEEKVASAETEIKEEVREEVQKVETLIEEPIQAAHSAMASNPVVPDAVVSDIAPAAPPINPAPAVAAADYNPQPFYPAPGPDDSPLKNTHDLVDAYLRAPNWEARIPYTFEGESMRAAIGSYYQKWPDFSLDRFKMKLFQMELKEEYGGPFWVYQITTSDAEVGGVPMILRVEDGNLKVDWEVYSEFDDEHFVRFKEGKIAAPHSFRLVAERVSEYPGPDKPGFTDLNQYLCFELNPPYGGYRAHAEYAFVKKGSALASEMESLIGLGDEPLAIIVTLDREAFSHGIRHLVIKDLITEGWFR